MANKAPSLNIPPSSISISVKIIDVCSIANVPAKAILTPPVDGFNILPPAPSYIFLLEHPNGHKLLFDLGIRKDWETGLAPEIVERFKKVGHKPTVEKNASEVLDECGIGKENINAVIWSHAHWDHIGDMTTFGPSTDLVVGAGFEEFFLGEGTKSALGQVDPAAVEGRNVREITFDGPGSLKIGNTSAFDYFGDGSLYILDTPGHCVAHICALVRTTTNPDTFMYLGGDAAHQCAEFRPSQYLPMPSSSSEIPEDMYSRHIPTCPCSWFEDLQVKRGRDPKEPLWQPAFGHNMDEVFETIGKMQECDADENIFVVLAHDDALRSPAVPMLPDAVNDWKAKGLGENLRWSWIGKMVAQVNGETVA